MKKYGLILAAAFTVMASPVSAQWSWSFNGCGGNSFATCASGSVSFDDVSRTITVLATNLADWGDTFTAVGLFNLGGTLPSAFAQPSPALSGRAWRANNGINGGGFTGTNAERFAIGSRGINGGFGEDGTQYAFDFSFNNTVALADLNALQNSVGVGFHVQGGPTGCSAKVGFTSSGVFDNANANKYAKCQPVSVPEPASSALLATGLLGLAMISRRRRGEFKV